MPDGREYNLISLLLDMATVRINELVEQCDRLKRENDDLREALAEAQTS